MRTWYAPAPAPGACVRLRAPYVGTWCADGARCSAQIDREEADVLPVGPARDDRLVSAEQWKQQADYLDIIDRALHPAAVPRLDPTVARQLGTRSLAGGSALSGATTTWQSLPQTPAVGEGS